MTRKKVTLAYISNDSDRRASFRKRKRGLIKKVSELSTLCGVEACAIIYGQFDAQPEVWPSRAAAEVVLGRYRSMSFLDQSRKTVNQESFNRQRIKKAEDQVRRLTKESKRKEIEKFMYTCLKGLATIEDFDKADAAALVSVINETLADVDAAIEKLSKNLRIVAPPPPPPPPPQLMLPPPPMEMGFEFPVVQQEAPLMRREELVGFPWTLVECPPSEELREWDDERMVVPYPNFFDGHGGRGGGGGGASVTKPGGDGGIGV